MKALAGIVLLLAACSSVASNSASDGAAGGQGGAGGQGASAGEGGTGESGGTGGAMGGAGGSAGQCGPGDLDCLCPGGTFECQNNRITCVCPPECTKADQCGANAICDFYDGNCGRNAAGYCRSVASASQRQCDQNQNPVCGCDGKLYDNACAAFVAGVSPNVAPTSDCASPPVLCSDGPSSVSCYPTQYCMVWMTGGSVSASCSAFDASCATPSCGCLSYNAATCNCELLPSGIVRLTCTR